MRFIMTGKLKFLVVCTIFGIVTADNITGVFEKGFGWNVQYVWSPPDGVDPTFKNVTIFRNDELIAAYAPGASNEPYHNITTKETCTLNVTCSIESKGQGKCTIRVNVMKNATDELYKATAFWSIGSDIRSIIANSSIYEIALKPKIVASQQKDPKMFNCSTEGVPAAYLKWTRVEGKDKKEAPAASNGTYWNETSKAWNSWSVYSWTKTDQPFSMTCTPTQLLRTGEVKIGLSETASAAGKYGAPGVFAVVLLSFAVLSKNIL